MYNFITKHFHKLYILYIIVTYEAFPVHVATNLVAYVAPPLWLTYWIIGYIYIAGYIAKCNAGLLLLGLLTPI